MTAVSASPSTDGGLSFVPTAWPSDATDANGRAQLTLVRGLEVVVRLSAAEREWYYRGTVPADDPENPDGGTMTLQMLLNDHEWEQIPAAVYTSAERKQQ